MPNILIHAAEDTTIQWASGGFLILLAVLALAWLVLFIAAMFSILRSANYGAGGKAIWILISLGLPLLGPIAWFMFGRDSTA
ncbi:PLD nuclease N-terminal domain-containing protein [Corynebacterium sp. HMSC28B08]|uniref:PLD nuclease N-terminal domain-containing protein n=1 Tax=Corynebacterium sp. HMSC28B08 TaxID=1581066 RepID=UPI0008A3DECD|nr:PLD nuclease N-terminal domain-containing protein [Corynebacterium sp. HMSC28B08]OFT88871.1 hypothetical protein HMPREF3098_06990 [Corynebacterium sp. HMSC28B08]